MKTYTKYNSSRFEDQLECEADGLDLLSSSVEGVCSLIIPQCLGVDKNKLVTEYLESASADNDSMTVLGRELAKLHREVTAKKFGYGRNNYIGLNPQSNTQNDDWGEFYFEQRLMYQISMLRPIELKSNWTQKFNQNRDQIISKLNSHRPVASVLHGDLWKGNVLFTSKGPALIDPAVYFGDRETDLAMTEVFGGFSDDFYTAYNDEFPLAQGHEQRKPLYKLYHLLNHLNIFGSSYLHECEKQWELFITSL